MHGSNVKSLVTLKLKAMQILKLFTFVSTALPITTLELPTVQYHSSILTVLISWMVKLQYLCM